MIDAFTIAFPCLDSIMTQHDFDFEKTKHSSRIHGDEGYIYRHENHKNSTVHVGELDKYIQTSHMDGMGKEFVSEGTMGSLCESFLTAKEKSND